MASFRNPKEVFQFIDDRAQASLPLRRELAWNVGIQMCYYEGVQWISSSWRGISRGVDRLRPDYDPDSVKLRFVNNITAKSVQKIAARTHPENFLFDCFPPERDASTNGYYESQVHEGVISTFITQSMLVEAAQVANFRRCCAGLWGIGLSLESGTRTIDGVAVPDKRICAFEFNPSCLLLDPAVQNPNLHGHDDVAYTDVWTADAIESAYGITLDRDNLQTIEQLEPMGEKLSTLSERRLYSKYARYSKTKGARVTQLHCKDETGLFGTWYVVIETGKDDRRIINEDDTATPFGGSGMPFALIHAHPRADSIYSWGEPSQIRGEQDKLNSIESMFGRIVQKHSGFQWIADRRFFGDKSGKDDIARTELTNQVGGIILGSLRSRSDGVQYPQLVQPPSPPPFLSEMMSRYPLEAKEKIHTSEGQYGKVPTHVPTENFQRSMDAADQVNDVRGQNDLRSYRYLIGVLHGTALKLAQERVPGVLGAMSQADFDEQDFAVVATADYRRPRTVVEVRPGTVNKRSMQAKKQDLDFALQNKAITPMQYQKALGEYDSPLTQDLSQMLGEARKAALRIITGENWDPMTPLGEWSYLFTSEFTRAMFDKRAKKDPSAKQRLAAAIQSIYQMQQVEASMAQPVVQSGEAAPRETSGAAPGGPVSVADVLDGLLSGSGAANAGGQTVPA